MARPTLFNHRKLNRLAASIGSKPAAIGHLELLWNACNESGDPEVGEVRDLELTADWRGDSGQLTAALLEAGGPGRAGFLDELEGGRYAVHDYWHHAPGYVKRRLMRECQRRTNGAPVTSQRPVSDAALTLTPSPSTQHTRKKQKARVRSLEGFGAFWEVYPKHRNRADAEKAWTEVQELPPVAELVEVVTRQREWADWTRDGGQAIPYPASWLRSRRWTDEASNGAKHHAGRCTVTVDEIRAKHGKPPYGGKEGAIPCGQLLPCGSHS